MPTFSFKRKYRLKSKKALASLFENSKKIKSYPINLVYNIASDREEPKMQVAISVPKRKMRRAVDRNKMKRRLREVFRKSSDDLIKHLDNQDITYNIMLIYQDDKHLASEQLEKKIIILLERFIKEIQVDITKPLNK